MKVDKELEQTVANSAECEVIDHPLRQLVVGHVTRTVQSIAAGNGVIVGELVGMADDGRTPLVVYPGRSGSKAVPARSTMDLHGAHIGKQVVLVFDQSSPIEPIVIGILRDPHVSALEEQPGHVDVDVDGERMIVTAREQLVLRCGKARITLTRAGKVLIEGTYVSSRSSGVNRIKGGSVQLN